MKLIILILTMLCYTASAQSNSDSVKAIVNDMFNGMRNSDTALIRKAFAPGALLQTIVKNREGEVRVRTEHIDSFILSIGRPRKEILDERITFETVKVDADLAIAWTPYQFFVDDKFSHCGVNSFQLVRIKGEWKIQYLIDTRRRTGCL